MIRRGVVAIVTRWLGRLRYPWLFALALALLVVDLAVPDLVPFVDEILLTIVTLLLGSRTSREPDRGGTGGAR